ncbi:MAG: hypothetical protein HY842_10385 [Bacteroidetes bacterium]|nr:hypothetical protein [Bacteroidota bacterium]
MNDLTKPIGQQAFVRLKELNDNNNELIISTQVIREFTNVTLRNAIYHKLDLKDSINGVIQSITEFYKNFEILYDNEQVLTNWLQLLPALTTNKDVFDFNIAATLRANGIRHILTHNANDFSKFSDWLTILPLFPQKRSPA